MKTLFSITRLLQGAKLLGASITIVLIAWAVGVFDVTGEVADAEADIVDFFFGPKSTTDRFSDALKNRGHDEPQIYDINGNVMFFSVNYSSKPPREVLREYQREFVKVGLNSRVYDRLSSDDGEERLVAGATGQIVPMTISDNYISMGGMLTKGEARNADELIREFDPRMNENDLFKAHRWIEIFTEPDSPLTTIISSWSDENFVYGKMIPGLDGQGDMSVDLEVPACPGCTRVNRMSDLAQHPPRHESNVFVTSLEPDYIRDFYEHAMLARGWELSEAQDAMERVLDIVDFDHDEMDALFFEREEQKLKVSIYQLEHSVTNVHTVLSR